MAFSITVPTSASGLLLIPSIFQTNQTEMENILGVEHYTYTSSLSGRHKPGIYGMMYVGTTLQIDALSSPATGSIALDTDLGLMKAYDGSAWYQVNMQAQPLLDAYKSADSNIASGSTETTVVCNTETSDPMSAHNTSTGKFTVPANGYYLIKVHLSMTCPNATKSLSGTLYRYNSSDVKQNQQTVIKETLSNDRHPVSIIAHWYLSATDYILVKVVHDYAGNCVLEGAQDKTWIKIYRIS